MNLQQELMNCGSKNAAAETGERHPATLTAAATVYVFSLIIGCSRLASRQQVDQLDSA